MDRVNTAGVPAEQVPRKVLGQKLSRKLKAISPSHRALLTHGLMNGEVELSHITFKQAKVVTEVSVGYANTAGKLTAEQREQVEHGLSLSGFHNSKQPVTEAMIDKFIARAGAERVLNALDKLTAPVLVAAE
jgi:hypothetical protein